MSTSHPSAFDTLRKQVFAFITGIVVLSHIHCHISFVSAVPTHSYRYNGSDLKKHSTLAHSDTSHRSWTKSNLNVLDHEEGKTSTAAGRMTAKLPATSRTSSSRQEVAALTSFKAAVSSDPFGSLKSWNANASVACSWDGVICSSHTRHVIGLHLSSLKLVGSVNSVLLELGRLRFLTSLDLSANNFTGAISRYALANFTGLVYWNMSYNQVQGEIPAEIGHLTNLTTLEFASNNLTGEIPVSVGNCTSMTHLDLGDNFLIGHIPMELGRVFGLQYLRLGNTVPEFPALPVSNQNGLSGSIPPSLGNCSSLTLLDLEYHPKLGGELPLMLGQLQSLQFLRIGLCGFIGRIPAWLGNLTELRAIRISYNQFHGDIPNELGNLPKLSELAIGSNHLDGEIPTALFNCTLMKTLTMEKNFLSGAIPSRLGSLTNLQTLILWQNNFTGVIPSTLSNCSRLKDFEAGDNLLMDPQRIPSWIGSLSNLVYFSLNDMNLRGEIPNDLGRLSKLQYLLLYENRLSGSIPSTLSNCSNMLVLVLFSNHLTGKVPSEMGHLANLELLLISQNFLTGSIPASLVNMSQLQRFDVSYNSLNGTVPEFLVTLSQLQTVGLQVNMFSGPLPDTLGNRSSLLELGISDNNLSGEIPPSYGNFTHLQGLDVSNNQISGEIPGSLAKCTRMTTLDLHMNHLEGNIASTMNAIPHGFLQHLSLSHNKFKGIVPSSLGKYQNLLFLDLSYNQLSGDLPADAISEMNVLVVLNVSHNAFTGSWPRQLGNLEAIQDMDISANNISGSILNMPSTIWKSLVRLDVSINNFSGVIPEFLASLPALSFFNASYNDFEGEIPYSGVFKSSLTAASFLGNPQLCGSILGSSRECAAPNIHHPCKGFKCKRAWVPTVCCAFVVAITGMLCSAKYASIRKRKADLDSTTIMTFYAPNVGRFSLKDVMEVIHEGDNNMIGSGAKSVVYRGSLPGPHGQPNVFAIKAFRSSSSQGRTIDHDCEFQGGHEAMKTQLVQEAEILSKLRHRNIVKVVSVCSSPDLKAIILEYMAQGSLHNHLYKARIEGETFSELLPWEKRLNIACDVNSGMAYLHHDLPEPLIHGDLKPSNILLNDDFVAKVADFGISKFVQRTGRDLRGEASASSFFGTIGYIPPEYASETKVSTKGDVYSYGIVLLELMTGKRPTGGGPGSADFGPDSDYRSWALKKFEEKPTELLDVNLQEEGGAESMKMDQMMLVLRLALFSTRENPQSRPSMDDLRIMLMHVKDPVQRVMSPIFAEGVAIANFNSAGPGPSQIGKWTNEDPNDANSPSL